MMPVLKLIRLKSVINVAVIGLLCFFSIGTNAQNNALCTKGLTYGEFIYLSKIKNINLLKEAMQQKCFELYTNSGSLINYQREYQKSDENKIVDYNELIGIHNDKLYEYRCSETEVCYKILKQLKRRDLSHLFNCFNLHHPAL